jgi:two-component sensor histidine kinase
MMLQQRHAICLFWGHDLNILYNDAYRPFLGNKEKDALGKPFSEIWSDVWDDVKSFAEEALSGNGTYTENMRLVMNRNGHDEETFWTFSYSPLYDDKGNVAGLIDIAVDTTPMVRSLRAQNVLRHELVHRVKNSMAVTTAVISATLRNAESLDQARETITHRIAALGKAQSMLNGSPTDVNVADTVAESMSAHLTTPARLTVSGPDLHISTQQGIGLSLAVYELATNALKYGALSNETGHVDISWTTSSPRGFEFVWQEIDGPTVEPPTRKGFGSRLTNQIVAAYFSGKGETNYCPEGVRFILSGSYQTETDIALLQSGMDLIATTSLPQKGAAVANAQEFAVSSNGDRWLLETDAGSNPTMVVRQANPA